MEGKGKTSYSTHLDGKGQRHGERGATIDLYRGAPAQFGKLKPLTGRSSSRKEGGGGKEGESIYQRKVERLVLLRGGPRRGEKNLAGKREGRRSTRVRSDQKRSRLFFARREPKGRNALLRTPISLFGKDAPCYSLCRTDKKVIYQHFLKRQEKLLLEGEE